MTFARKKLGSEGEDKARRFLEKMGLVFLGKNIRLFCGEIDLLMREKNTLVIVEVKTKHDFRFGSASDMVTLKKQKKLIQLAKVLAQKYPNQPIRIDVVAIDQDHLRHFVSAVEGLT